MQAVRKRAADTVDDDVTASMPTTNRKMRELRENDLRTISMYRQQSKHEDIANHLMGFITREVHIRLMPGYVEFFEFILQNPYQQQHSFSIACNDDELRYSNCSCWLFFHYSNWYYFISVVTDAREWRRLKTVFEVSSDTEENMFTNQTGIIDQSGLKYPQIFMRAKESVHIPFKLQTYLAKLPAAEHKTSSNPFAQEQTYSVVEKNYNEKTKSKQIKVRLSF
jgi:nephrocystin-4